MRIVGYLLASSLLLPTFMPAVVLATDVSVASESEITMNPPAEGSAETEDIELPDVTVTSPNVSTLISLEPEIIPPIDSTEPEEIPAVELDERTILISKLQTGPAQNEFVELFNPTDTPVVLDSWRLEYLSASHVGGPEPTRVLATLTVTIEAQGYYVLKHSDFLLEGSDANFSNNLASGSIAKTSGAVRLVRNDASVVDMVGWGDALQRESSPLPSDDTLAWQRCSTEQLPMIDTDNNYLDFRQYDSTELRATPQCPIEELPAPINTCEGVFISEIGANLDDQFVELYNPTNEPISMTGCLLQTNRSATATHILEGEIGAGKYLHISIKDTALTLTKTTTGTVFLLTSDASAETNLRYYENLQGGTSWIWGGGDDWKQTYLPTPGFGNIWQEYLPCDDGYERNAGTGMCRKIVTTTSLSDCGEDKYRNEETGRCRNVVSLAVVVPCKDTQYRSEETGRCRNIASSANALKPCGDDQYRSEETNRCRSIASVVSALVPCREGQERSAETNRCRTVAMTDIPDAAFAVEPVADSVSTFVGWWTLGGIGVVALGYAGYEWRREVLGGLRRIGIFFTTGK